MCLITDILKPFIAKKDITVYKVLFSSGRSIHWGFVYTFDRIYQTEIKESADFSAADSIDEKFLEENYPGWDKNQHSDKLKCFGQGFHSYSKPSRCRKLYWNEYMYEATIPNGSIYYKDKTGLLISNQLIIHNKIIPI